MRKFEPVPTNGGYSDLTSTPQRPLGANSGRRLDAGWPPARRAENAQPGTGRDRSVMNDIDDDRDESAFAQLDLSRYHSMPCSWSRPCAEAVRDGPTRSTPASTLGALFGVPDIARDGDQDDPTGNVWQQGRDNL